MRLLGADEFDDLVALIFFIDAVLDWLGERDNNLMPEARDLIARRNGVEHAPAFEELLDGENRNADGLSTSAAGTNDFSFERRVDEEFLFRVRLGKMDGVLDLLNYRRFLS